MASIRLWITLWIGLCVLPLAGCGVNVRKTEIAEPLTPPAEARPVPIRFGELQAKVRRGDRIGGYVIGFTCLGPFDPITWTTGPGNDGPRRCCRHVPRGAECGRI